MLADLTSTKMRVREKDDRDMRLLIIGLGLIGTAVLALFVGLGVLGR